MTISPREPKGMHDKGIQALKKQSFCSDLQEEKISN